MSLVRIVEAGRIDEEHASPVKNEFIGALNANSVRSQVRPNTKVGPAAHIDRLQTVLKLLVDVQHCGHEGQYPSGTSDRLPMPP